MTAPTLTASPQAAHQVQGIIAAAAMRDAAKLWPLLDRNRIDATFPAWLQAMILLVRNYHRQSSAAASETYRAARAAHTRSPAPRSIIHTAPAPSEAWLRQAFGYTGPGMLTRDTAQPGTAQSTTLGTAARIVQSGGRLTTLHTVQHDPVAVGWYRVTDGHPCAFCALLASRGVAYKSESTAEFHAHNACGCIAAPAFTHDLEMPEVNRQALDVYRNRGNGPALQAFRRAWDDHQAT